MSKLLTESFDAVEQLRRLGCEMVIPWGYINECASHLLRALDYESLDDFKEDLQYSQNAYVANYYGLLSAGCEVPPTILDYLKTFSQAVTRRVDDKAAWVRLVMPDIQSLLRDYGVAFEPLKPAPSAIRRDIEIEYTYQLEQARAQKATVLVQHDVDVLADVKTRVTQDAEHRIVLTWDRAMIAVGRKIADIGWVVSPDFALDFTQPYLLPRIPAITGTNVASNGSPANKQKFLMERAGKGQIV